MGVKKLCGMPLKKETSFQIALMNDGWDSPVYLYNEQVYEEDYMLRIVKLKAFL